MKAARCAADLQFYRFLATPENRPVLIDYLTDLQSAPWEGLDETAFAEAYRGIKRALAADPLLDPLFDRHLTAHCLLSGRNVPPWLVAFISEHMRLEDHFPEMEVHTLLDGRWAAVAVPMVIEGKGKIRWFMVGRIDRAPLPALWPPWAKSLIDRESRTAVADAARAARKRIHANPDASLYLFPLAVANDCCQFQGTSLGLPLAIGFMKVLADEPIAESLVASGAIDAAGAVGKVGGLHEKRSCALKDGRFSLLVYPSANHPLPRAAAMEALQVADLDQAWMFAGWYAPGNANRLAALSLMPKDPRAFVDGMNRVDSHWIRQLAQSGALTPVVARIAASADLFPRYVSNLEKTLDRWRLDDAETYLRLISDQTAARAAAAWPLTSFRFFTAALALANHRGDVKAAEAACQKADALFTEALRGDLNRCADYLNHRQVARHNRYRFKPELHAHLRRFLNMLEARHQVQRDFGCPTDPVLARLYGTIAQNFAFCGPMHLADTIRYAHLAMEAFGNGIVPEYRLDVLRQHAYLTYAHLDAADYRSARENLFAFMEVKDWDQVRQACSAGRLTHWHHAAMARYLADTGDQDAAADYLDWCRNHRDAMVAGEHPRQLWSYNLGRIALALNRKDAAEKWLEESLALCLGMQNRPTIAAMALLAVSALWKLRSIDAVCDGSTVDNLVATALRLNPDHFKPLAESDRESLLAGIWENPSQLFPFSYR